MGIRDYFRPVPTKSVDEVRELLRKGQMGSFTIVDVRQPEEYEKAHLPGSVLIPLDQLGRRSGELDSEKPTVTYCSSGMRSRSAAEMLENLGFKDVSNMKGGIRAWDGAVAEGTPEAGMAHFSDAVSPEEMTALAWVLEDGSARFYREVSKFFNKVEQVRFFMRLNHAEEHHKNILLDLYRGYSGNKLDEGFPASVLGEDPKGDIMEGGVSVQEALEWAREKPVGDVFELLISLETNSLDLYVRMGRKVKDERSKRVFTMLAEEERRHIEILTISFRNIIGAAAE